MNEKEQLDAEVEKLVAADPSYRREGYSLVLETLGFALARLGERRHLTAAEVVASLVDYACEQYGPLAQSVLAEWGLVSPADVGRIVYKLIGAGLLAASAEDSPDDFPAVTAWFERVSDPPVRRYSPARVLPKIDVG